jgi:drug/metabolite transporter (DMT)-like permease
MSLDAVAFGVLSALSLGAADFMASRSSAALGAETALAAMLAAGVLGLVPFVAAAGLVLPATPFAWGLVALHGGCLALALLLFFTAMAKGPVSVAAPIVAAYPALIVAFAALGGTVPTVPEFAAIALVLAGAMLLGAATERLAPEGVRMPVPPATLGLATMACAVYALAVIAGQSLAATTGELSTLWLGRIAGLALLAVLLLARRAGARLPRRWWPFVALHGALDAAGLLFLLAGSRTTRPELTAVVGGAFSLVTVGLAWALLGERLHFHQRLGVALVIGGVAALAVI